MKRSNIMNRRRFIKQFAQAGAGLAGASLLAPAWLAGKDRAVPPSERITMACIGVGWQGTENMKSFLELPDVQIVAVCDVDQEHLAEAKNTVDTYYGDKGCETTSEFRDIIERKDIDVVSLGLPDHWHAIPAIEAARAGKDIFGEKPLSHTFTEGVKMVEAVNRYGRIWQTGSWQRSLNNFRLGAELVLNGRIGKVHTVEVGLPSGHNDFEGSGHLMAPTPPPAHLDYNRWLGPAKVAEYCAARVHKNWRWIYDYGGGQLMDWVGHHVDIAHWGMGTENTGPYEVEGEGEFPDNGLWNTATRYRLKAKYANGITMIIAGGHSDIRSGTKWIGSEGSVWVDRGNQLVTTPGTLKSEVIGPEEIHLYRSPGHWRNFIDSVKSREKTLAPAEVAHRSATPGHLGLISMQLGRKIKFDPKTQTVLKDPSAERLLSVPYRTPWHV